MTLIERDSRRPCPLSEQVCAIAILFHGRCEIWRWAVGWLVLITAM
ncbi:hypothetical protein NGM33_10985 [Nocardiopsis dassonvillei]|nr:hypothetical protein [Nocardiopsis dassonvillei]MCP3013854.1 hypothetical protein [Nocardiopsis dassonvillei]